MTRATEQSKGRAQTSGLPVQARPLLTLVSQPASSGDKKLAQRAWGSGNDTGQVMTSARACPDLLPR
ncbi:hypothetical protein J1605_007323 [Eschrichtius robustus]|uniref:Uncharacterized protein n=1 Tax=Eschrichtius robustus TaxID=9764 RepID=A0AB34H2T2_ESCRO|nr:hypothetical protein J1605_007323 [Eschrichtius robustus]